MAKNPQEYTLYNTAGNNYDSASKFIKKESHKSSALETNIFKPNPYTGLSSPEREQQDNDECPQLCELG